MSEEMKVEEAPVVDEIKKEMEEISKYMDKNGVDNTLMELAKYDKTLMTEKDVQRGIFVYKDHNGKKHRCDGGKLFKQLMTILDDTIKYIIRYEKLGYEDNVKHKEVVDKICKIFGCKALDEEKFAQTEDDDSLDGFTVSELHWLVNDFFAWRFSHVYQDKLKEKQQKESMDRMMKAAEE